MATGKQDLQRRALAYAQGKVRTRDYPQSEAQVRQFSWEDGYRACLKDVRELVDDGKLYQLLEFVKPLR